MTPAELWAWLPFGYVLTVSVETPVLVFGLSRRHSLARKLFAGLWLTACTYPIVVLVLPILIPSRGVYVAVAETFAPAAECTLFWLAFRERERSDAAYAQFGEVAVPNQSGHIYLVTNRHGQHRLITVSRPTITGEMYGILTTLLSGRGSALER